MKSAFGKTGLSNSIIHLNFKQLRLNVKNNIYIKPFQVKCGWAKFYAYHRHMHPSHHNIDRESTSFVREIKDYKRPHFKSYDPLWHDSEKDKFNGGILQLLSDIKNYNVLSESSKSTVSPYKAIYLQYHIAKDNLQEYYPLLKQIDKYVNAPLLEPKIMSARYIYAYLYTAYKLGISRPENITFFEHILQSKYNIFHCSWVLDLLEVVMDNKYDPTLLEKILKEHFAQILIKKYKQEISLKQDLRIRLIKLLHYKKLTQFPEVWNAIINDLKTRHHKFTVDQYDVILKALDYYYNEPASKRFNDQEIKDIISAINKTISSNSNHSYFYNTAETRRFSFKELVAKRNEFAPELFCLYAPQAEAIKKTIKVKDEFILTMDVLLKEIEKRANSGSILVNIQRELKKEYPGNEEMITQAIDEIYKNQQANLLEKLKKEKKLDKLFEKPAEAKPVAGASINLDKAGLDMLRKKKHK